MSISAIEQRVVDQTVFFSMQICNASSAREKMKINKPIFHVSFLFKQNTVRNVEKEARTEAGAFKISSLTDSVKVNISLLTI